MASRNICPEMWRETGQLKALKKLLKSVEKRIKEDEAIIKSLNKRLPKREATKR